MKIKPGASARGVRSELILALLIADAVYARHGVELVVTSMTDGTHSQGSLHYVGLAGDLRISNVPPETLPIILEELKAALGPQYDVCRETDHLHVEFQPKTP